MFLLCCTTPLNSSPTLCMVVGVDRLTWSLKNIDSSQLVTECVSGDVVSDDPDSLQGGAYHHVTY